METEVQEQVASLKKRIFILDDHPMTRHGLSQLINSQTDLIVCGEEGSAPRALAQFPVPLPDLVLVDITLAGKSGLEFIRDLHALYPEVCVLVLSMHDEHVYAERVLRAGGRGYIMKTEGGEKLLGAIRRVLQGKIYVSDEMSAAILGVLANRRPHASEAALSVLTDREFEVYQLIGQGLSTRQISARLGLSIPTIGTHRMHIREKLKLDSSAELMQHAVRWAASQQVI